MDENEESVLHCPYDTKSEEYTTLKWKKDNKTLKHTEGKCITNCEVTVSNTLYVLLCR